MQTPAPPQPPPGSHAIRSVLLALAAVWFLIQGFSRLEEDSTVALISLAQRLAFGFALVAVALIDWRQARWWWFLVALLVVAAVWTATGHLLLFLFGTI